MRRLPPLPRKVTRCLGSDNRTIINTLVTDLIETNLKNPERIGFSADVFAALEAIYKYNFDYIYSHPDLMEYAERTEKMLEGIFEFEERELASKTQDRWGHSRETDPLPIRELHSFIAKTYPPDEKPSLSQIIVDHISLMTDRFARNLFDEIVLPKPIGRAR